MLVTILFELLLKWSKVILEFFLEVLDKELLELLIQSLLKGLHVLKFSFRCCNDLKVC